MTSNGYGDVKVHLDQDMAAYDHAPPRLRWLIRNAVSPYSSQHIMDAYWDLRDEGVGQDSAIDWVAVRIRRGDAEETIAAYGPTHPEARLDFCEAAA